MAAATIMRITPGFLAEERRALGAPWYRQECECGFEALEGLVYPDLARCMVASLPGPFWGGEAAAHGRRVGGLDFGLRNPFAAVWGTLDRRDVLWLTGEHYSREKSLDWHCRYLPRDVTWYADPAGAREIRELCCAGYTMHRGDNELRPGLAAVRAGASHSQSHTAAGFSHRRCPTGGVYEPPPVLTVRRGAFAPKVHGRAAQGKLALRAPPWVERPRGSVAR